MTLSKLFITTTPWPPITDILVDLCISVVAVIAIIFAASVSGPMQWLINGVNSTKSVVFAGTWETAGTVSLALLLYAEPWEIFEFH